MAADQKKDCYRTYLMDKKQQSFLINTEHSRTEHHKNLLLFPKPFLMEMLNKLDKGGMSQETNLSDGLRMALKVYYDATKKYVFLIRFDFHYGNLSVWDVAHLSFILYSFSSEPAGNM